MGLTPIQQAKNAAAEFALDGKLIGVEPFGGGHINDSFILTYSGAAGDVRYLLQRINSAVFPDPALVMENIQRVTTHLRRRLQESGARDIERRVLTLAPSLTGEPFRRDDADECWRAYRFIEGTTTAHCADNAAQAEQAGRAFGEFQRLLADMSGPPLHETIPDFHNTPRRFDDLSRAVESDPHNRAAGVQREIEFAGTRRGLAGVLLDLHQRGEIPARIVHNDAKISNVLFDRRAGQALCVVDLDTVMPGLSLYDFGDMVRSMTALAAEDEPDLSRVELRPDFFKALTTGYLAETREMLSPAERGRLVTAGKVITLEQGVRFLSDFINGDTYYKTTRPNHNLDRCRAQFKLLESMEQSEEELTRTVEEVSLGRMGS